MEQGWPVEVWLDVKGLSDRNSLGHKQRGLSAPAEPLHRSIPSSRLWSKGSLSEVFISWLAVTRKGWGVLTRVFFCLMAGFGGKRNPLSVICLREEKSSSSDLPWGHCDGWERRRLKRHFAFEALLCKCWSLYFAREEMRTEKSRVLRKENSTPVTHVSVEVLYCETFLWICRITSAPATPRTIHSGSSFLLSTWSLYCSSGYPRTLYVEQAGIEFTEFCLPLPLEGWE